MIANKFEEISSSKNEGTEAFSQKIFQNKQHIFKKFKIMSDTQKLILGSSSKWRRALFKDFGVGEFECDSPDIDEKAIRDPVRSLFLFVFF